MPDQPLPVPPQAHASVSRELSGQGLSDPIAASSYMYQDFGGNPLFAANGPSADDVSPFRAGGGREGVYWLGRRGGSDTGLH